MPLPSGSKDEKVEWPPKRHRPMLEEITEHSAWYSGDTDALRHFYGAEDARSRERRKRRLKMFWQRRHDNEDKTSIEDRRLQLHVPIASDICTVSADLLFAEAPTFVIPEAEPDAEPPDETADDGPTGDSANTRREAMKAQDRLTELVEETELHNGLLEAADIGAGLSGVYLRAAWDQEVSDRPMMSVVPATNALPEWSFGVMRAVTFWWEMARKENVVHRLLERHENGVILHGLYQGTKTHLGVKVPLTDLDETQPLADSLDDGDETKLDWLDGLLVRYVPNMRPNRRIVNAPHGRSDLQGIEGLMDALDETMTSWMRDIRLGKRRVIVDESFLDVTPAQEEGRGGKHLNFNIEKEIFAGLSMDPTTRVSGSGITLVDFDIRAEDHRATAMALVERIVSSAGYAMQSFTPEFEGVADNASALRIRERKSFQTKAKKERYWRNPVEEIAELLLAIDKNIFSRDTPVLRPRMSFADSIAVSEAELAQTGAMMRAAEMASTDTLVRMAHPDWSGEQIKAEVEAIGRESARQVPDPIAAGDAD